MQKSAVAIVGLIVAVGVMAYYTFVFAPVRTVEVYKEVPVEVAEPIEHTIYAQHLDLIQKTDTKIRAGPVGLPGDLMEVRKDGLLSLTGVNLDKMTDRQLQLVMHSFLDNTDIVCRRRLRMGTVGDGGWEVCDDEYIRPKEPCIIYSFGISYEFSFDDDAARVYKCDVYSFDPSMDKMQTSNRSERVHFYKIGLHGRTTKDKRGWQLYTLQDIRKMLGHESKTIDVLKMDIESSEWPSVPQMVESGQFDNIRQFLIEYHVVSGGRSYLLPKLKAIQAIEKAGFKKFYVHKNPACVTKLNYPILRTMCYEVHYMKAQ